MFEWIVLSALVSMFLGGFMAGRGYEQRQKENQWTSTSPSSSPPQERPSLRL